MTDILTGARFRRPFGLVVRRAHDYARAELVAALGLPAGTGWAEALAEVGRLRAALRPFGRHADLYRDDALDAEILLRDARFPVTLGDLRRARDTLGRAQAGVELLREARGEHHRRIADEALSRLEQAESELEQLRALRNSALHAGTDEVAEERAAVVAWLRLHSNSEDACMFASWIERGEHRREEKER